MLVHATRYAKAVRNIKMQMSAEILAILAIMFANYMHEYVDTYLHQCKYGNK